MGKAFLRGALTAALMLGSALPALAAAPAAMPANATVAQDDWWKRAVVYELYPRSFADSNNDGIGDIKGITQHLDYLADLGVDAVWMTPMFPSPQADFGYDVADYNNVDPQFGTVGDVDALIAKGKGQNVPGLGLPSLLPLTAQLQSDTGVCWEATFSAPLVNTNTQFKARSD